MQITTIGLDLAKHVFQVHGVDANEAVVEKRRLRRGQVLGYFAKLAPCRVGLEACATAHFWARELRRLGHEVRLIPPQYVKAYLKRGKNDAADAAAICEAATRPSMRFVPIKSEEQQAVLQGGQSQSVDPGPAGTLRTAEGGGSTGQQDRADRLGGDDKRRMLSAGCCGLTKPCDLPAKACRRENEMEVSVVPTGWVNLKKSRASNPRI